MSDKKKVSNANVDVKDLSMADLYALFLFVSSNWNRGFGPGQKNAEKAISMRMKEVEGELFFRAYGQNPFSVTTKTIVIEGQKPEDVIAAMPMTTTDVKKEHADGKDETKQQTFVVADKNVKEEDSEHPNFVVTKG